MRLRIPLVLALLAAVCAAKRLAADATGPVVFRAGAAMVDITPTVFPVIVNGMVEERTATMAHDALMARALVLDDGKERIAIVVVDSLMLTRAMLDDVKEQTQQQTGIPTDRMLISATHTHSAPSAMPCLGSRVDSEYAQFLPGQIVRSIVQANERLTPAQVGWAVITDDQHNHCRRWIFRSDRMSMTDPFGQTNDRVRMHPEYVNPDYAGPSGPADTDLTLLSVQTLDGKPLAVLGNYAMHYYGSPLVSGDFCGRFGNDLAKLIGAVNLQPGFVGMMSQGTSGDSMRMDYSKPVEPVDLDAYAKAVAANAFEAYKSIEYQPSVGLAMAETTLKLNRRTPDESRLNWARETAAKVVDRQPVGLPEVYAFEQLYLHDDPTAELKLQAIRIGNFGITAIPDEVYGITGIKLKNRSPLQPTMNIELANGAEGYIPPPEQHRLGGYCTWEARTAGLEEQAEPLIVEALTKLLEKVAGKPRRPTVDESHAYSRAVVASKPRAFWRLGEIEGTVHPSLRRRESPADGAAGQQYGDALDSVGDFHGLYEDGIALYLPGPRGNGLIQQPRGNRAAHFAGGRVSARVPYLGRIYSVECWLWNGFPNGERAVTGYFFSRGPDGDAKVAGDHLGIGGNYLNQGWDGKLLLFNGNERNEALTGQTVLETRMWHHVVFVRSDRRVTVFLNGNPEPEIEGELEPTFSDRSDEVFLGGRNDRLFGLEGRLDEVALYDRAITAQEVAAHYAVSDVLRVPQVNETVAQPDSPPLSPEESMKKTHVREGFELQLVAAEPLVIDPVAVDWAPDGKLWVAEMADYPSGMDNHGKPGGRIRCLEDRDGDGKYESSAVLLEDVAFPTGVMAWGRGVIVTAAPEIFYAEDSDRDGKADIRRTLFTGFLEGNQQLRVNGLRWGMDNWVHCASGSHHAGYGADSQILSHATKQKTAIGSRDFRFRPDEGLIDPQSGPSQFGRNRDAWGNWFGEQNSYPLWHYVLEDPYIRRNSHFAPPDPRHLLTPANPPVYAAAPPEKRFHSFEQSGRYTSACSGMVYLDDLLFGDEQTTDGTAAHNGSQSPLPRAAGEGQDEGLSATFSPGAGEKGLAIQHAFTCEPVSNLVQHNLLIDDGVSFRLERDPSEANSKTDFFASEDRWCRPVMVRTGPDGALWIVDMYRYMIEHPHWLPKEGQDELRPFFRSGDDRGRIYRIVPTGSVPRRVPRMDLLSTVELVAALESPNGWQRDTAQRLLVMAKDQSAVAGLERLVMTSRQPLARLHALCTLDGLNALSQKIVETALKDAHPGVRRQAVRLSVSASVATDLLIGLVDDPDARVRLQLACTLGDCVDESAGVALGKLLVNDADPFLRAGVMSSLNAGNIGRVVDEVVAAIDEPARSHAVDDPLIDDLFGQVAAMADDPVIVRTLTLASNATVDSLRPWQMTALASELDSLAARGWVLADHMSREQQAQLAEAFAIVRLAVADTAVDDVSRAASVRLLLRQPEQFTEDAASLQALLVPQTPAIVQQAAVSHIGRQSGGNFAKALLAGWPSHSPLLRSQILSVLSSREAWVVVLVEQLEQAHVSAAEIDAPMRQRLLTARDAAVRGRLEKVFASGTSADRRTVMESFQPALKLTGEAARGAILFGKKCSACHKQGNVGHEAGPNLASLTTRTPEALFASILDPSAAVEAKYLNFVVATTSGRSVIGMLSTETGSSVTLVAAEGKSESVLRTDIEELRSTGKSLMPDGLEKDLSKQDLADVIEYVKTLR